MSKHLVVGSVAFDSIRTPYGKVERGIGGSATHYTNAAFLNPPSVVGVVGEDFPDEYIGFFEKKGADVSGIKRVSGKTFFWEGYYEDDMNTAITVTTELGVFEHFKPELSSEQKDIPYLFLANIDPELQLGVLKQMKSLKLAALDSMNLWIQIKKDALLEVISKVNIVFLNDGEAAMLTGKSNVIDAADDILKMGPQYVIIKKGSNGSVLYSGDKYFTAPVFPTKNVKDPTGAGDSFAGGFMSYISGKDDVDFETMKQAVVAGSVIASFNVEGFTVDGIRNATEEQVKERYNYIKQITAFGDFSL